MIGIQSAITYLTVCPLINNSSNSVSQVTTHFGEPAATHGMELLLADDE